MGMANIILLQMILMSHSAAAGIGRMRGNVYCTVWLISEDVSVSAGHCVDYSPPCPQNGWYVEFNVPLSDPDGDTNPSMPEDKYEVYFDIGGLYPQDETEWNDEGLGNDWVVGRLEPNVITGKTAGEAQGCWINLDYQEPSTDDPIRITGYGTRDPKDELHLAQLTHLGTLDAVAEMFVVRYVTDTSGGQSGAPIINDETGKSIGVHTSAGCVGVDPETGSNHGMRNDQPMFKDAVARYLGVDPINQVISPDCPADPSKSPTKNPTAFPTEVGFIHKYLHNTFIVFLCSQTNWTLPIFIFYTLRTPLAFRLQWGALLSHPRLYRPHCTNLNPRRILNVPRAGLPKAASLLQRSLLTLKQHCQCRFLLHFSQRNCHNHLPLLHLSLLSHFSLEAYILDLPPSL